MKKSISLFLFLLPFLVSGQIQNYLKSDSTNVCILKVDYKTYKFNGANLSFFKKSTLDSFPFITNTTPWDFKSITFILKETKDTLFYATDYWLHKAIIKIPESFGFDTPFDSINKKAMKPNFIQFYDTEGGVVKSKDSVMENRIWNAIDSIEIVNIFAGQDSYQAHVYPHKPMGGTHEWIAFLIHSESATGIKNQIHADNFKVYPNPVKDYLYIELPENAINTNYVLTDINGKQVSKVKYTREKLEKIDISNLRSGIYLLHITEQDKVSTFKIIKN